MPELPEVETIRMGLEKYLIGKKITGVEVRLKKIVTGDTRQAAGACIKGIRRFGKALSIDLDNGWSIAAHIKLTGQFIYVGPDSPERTQPSVKLVGQLPNKWTHVIFELTADKGTEKLKNKRTKNEKARLFYNDVRQFGWIRVLPTGEVEKLPFIHELGPEPSVTVTRNTQNVTRGNILTLEKFQEILKNKSTKIKPLLMDQKKIGGVGNIYANDALFLAKIDPSKPAAKLSGNEAVKLYRSVLEVLKRGLKYGGATEINFVNVLGQPGGYQEHFLAYGQEGKPCSRCGTTIRKTRIGGRGTYFCPSCQK